MPGRSIYVDENPALTGGSPQAIHEQLWAEGQRRRLQVRGVLAGAGLIAGFYLGGVGPALVLAALVAGADTIYHWRQHAASAVWRKGQRGERRTAPLVRVALGWRGHTVLHGRTLPGGPDLDHVLIGPTGVVVVQNQAIAPDTEIAAFQDKLFIDQRPVRGAKMAAGLREIAEATAALLEQRLARPVPVCVVSVVYGGRLDGGKVTGDGVTLLRAHRLPGWVRRRREVLAPEEIEAVTDAARSLPIAKHASIVR